MPSRLGLGKIALNTCVAWEKFSPGETKIDCQESPKKESVGIIQKAQFNN